MSLLSLDQIKTLYDDLRGRIEDGGSVINFLPVDNASGSIASFPDGADNVPVKSLIAQITPLQDLHGYDHPWPAGGGKNLLDLKDKTYTSNGVTAVVKDGIVTVSGTANGNTFFALEKNTNLSLTGGTAYILNGAPNAGTQVFLQQNYIPVGGSGQEGARDYGNGAAFTPSDSAPHTTYLYIGGGYTANNLVFKPMIRLASDTDPTFAPYSNICPISGWTGAKITGTGINVWNEEWKLGRYDAITGEFVSVLDRICSKDYIPISPNNSYYFYFGSTVSGAQFSNVAWYDANKEFISSNQNFKNVIVTTPAKARYATISIVPQYGTTYNSDISINYPSTDTSYHAYNGSQIDVSWTDEAGTVYGGTLTYIGGGKYSLQATHKKDTFTWADGTNATTVSDYTRKNFALTSPALTASGMTSNIAPFMQGQTSNPVPHTDFSTSSVARVYLPTTTDNATSIELLYTFATLPDPIILDAEDVKTLLGDNNIFVDTGDVSVDYRADIALYIQKVVNA